MQLFLFGPRMGALARALAARGRGDLVRGTIEEASRDPADLVASLDLPAGAVVLVKGSRGMRLERVVRHLQNRWSPVPAALSRALEPPMSVLVTGGRGVRATVQLVSGALRTRGIPCAVIAVAHEDIQASAAASPAAVVVLTDLSDLAAAATADSAAAVRTDSAAAATAGSAAAATAGSAAATNADSAASVSADSTSPTGVDVELRLAEKAQLFLRASGLRAAVLCMDDPGAELLQEILPEGVRVLRFGTRESRGPLDLRATSIEVAGGVTRVALTGPHSFPASIEVAGEGIAPTEDGIDIARAVMAACLVVLVLAGPPPDSRR